MFYRLKKLLSINRNLIFVPKCASCDERLSPIPEKGNMTYDKVCFCRSCSEKWERAKTEMCPICYKPAGNCTCAPAFFFNYQPMIPSLCFYHPESNDVQSKAIITMKRQNFTELFEFMAIELYPSVNNLLKEMDISGEDCLFTFVPRTGPSTLKSGFDQGKQLSISLAKLFKARSYPLFLRIGGREQKKLDKKSRKKNARRSIKLNRAMLRFSSRHSQKDIVEFVKGKSVVIIDDVLTSGSTLRQAVELLRSAGAKNTVVVTVAKTYGKSEKKK